MRQGTGKTIFLLCNLYVSAVVGAGFATGQEIMQFFSCYGRFGFMGALLAGIIFMMGGPLILKKVIAYDAYSMGELLSFRFGKPAEKAIGIMNFLLELSVLSVMMAGLRTLLYQMGIPNTVAILFLAVVLYAASFCNAIALRINNILTPVVIFGILGTCIMLLVQHPNGNSWSEMEMDQPYPWWVSALLYAGFNLLLAMPALCLVGKKLQKEKERAVSVGGALGGVLIWSMAMLSQWVLFSYGAELRQLQMPVVELTVRLFPLFGTIYQGVIFAAMASSAVICIRCIVDLLPHSKKKKNFLATGIVCMMASGLSLLDFSQLISILYPILGGIGILAMLAILW